MKICLLVIVSLLILTGCTKARRNGPTDGGAGEFGKRAYYHFVNGEFIKAQSLYSKALLAARKADLPLRVGTYAFNIGRIFLECGEPDTAVLWLTEARKNAQRYGDYKAANKAAGLIAMAYSQKGDHSRAWDSYNAGAVTGSTDDPPFWVTIHAVLSWRNGNVDSSQVLLDRAASQYKKDRNFAALASVLYYKGMIAGAQGNLESADLLLNESLKLFESFPERYRKWRVLLGCAAVASCRNKPDEALHFYQRAVSCAPSGVKIPSIEIFAGCKNTFMF